MNRLKSNKGVTGIDVAMSIIIIVITIGVISSMYSSYSRKYKQIQRASVATNLAMEIIQNVNKMEFNNLKTSSLNVTNENKYGLLNESSTIPKGFEIIVSKLKVDNNISEDLMYKVNVEVKFDVGENTNNVLLSTIKKKNNIGQVEVPNLKDDVISKDITAFNGEVNKRFLIKYSTEKQGYVEAKENDDDWYSISSKRFALVVYANENSFNKSGVIKLENCSEIYLWIPSFGKENDEYRFLTSNGRPIIYSKDSEGLFYYMADNNNSMNKDIGSGKWIKVDKNLNPVAESSQDVKNAYEILTTKTFTWEPIE